MRKLTLCLLACCAVAASSYAQDVPVNREKYPDYVDPRKAYPLRAGTGSVPILDPCETVLVVPPVPPLALYETVYVGLVNESVVDFELAS